VAFGPHAPVILTGDDYGNVNVYRLHRIFNKLVDTTKFTVKEERDWRLQEAQHLKSIIENKNNNSNNNGGTNPSDGSSDAPPTLAVPEN
jgi:hypothetical protein